METTWNRKHGIATIRISNSSSPTDQRALDGLLAHPHLKGIIVRIEEKTSARVRDDIDELHAQLSAAAVPVAGILQAAKTDGASQIFDACHFTFSSEDEAEAFLAQLTLRRPPRVIRAVMTSLNNGRRMPQERALLEETRLFCSLCVLKRNHSEDHSTP